MLGGTPVRPEGPPAWPFPDPDVQAALVSAVASGVWGQYHGEHVCALEAELAEFHDVPHALTCASGTVAVEAALRALRVGTGDEVVMAAYDYESTFLTVHAIGAKPVLIDVHPATWQLDPAHLEAAFTSQTKAVICSHLHGGIVPMSQVMALARKHGVGVVEDAAQAPGATVEGKPAGTWGDVGTLSFGGSKLLTAGRGGALLFNNPQLFQRAKTWLYRGLQQWAPLSELQAAALRPQLRKLKEATQRRWQRVQELLGMLAEPNLSPFHGRKGRSSHESHTGESRVSTSGWTLHPLIDTRASPDPAASPSFLGKEDGELGCENLPAFYKLGFQHDPAAFGLSREVFVKALRAEGVAFDAGFKALHVGRSPSRFYAPGVLAHSSNAHERCVILHHPVLSGATAESQQVADAVAKVYRYRDRF